MDPIPSAVSVAADAINPDLTSLVQYGVLGLVVVALVTGVLTPRWVVARLEAEVALTRAALDKEREAHADSRSAITELARASNAALETAKMATALLEKLDHPRAPRGSR